MENIENKIPPRNPAVGRGFRELGQATKAEMRNLDPSNLAGRSERCTASQ